MSLDTLLEAARFIENREIYREHDCMYLEKQRVLLDSPPPRFILTPAELKETSPSMPQTRKRLWSNCSRASEKLSRASKKHKPSRSSELYSTILFDSCDDDVVKSNRLLDKEVNSDEHSVDGVIGSLQGEVERLNRTLLEVKSRMSSVCAQAWLNTEKAMHNARANESFGKHLKAPSRPPRGSSREPYAPLSDSVYFSPIRSSTPSAANLKRSEKLRRDDDEVPIGSGKTLIPRHVYNQIDWNSYTIATRKLLMAVFPRSTLATHSLTGKASPAFQAKPAKLRLDARNVNDIVMTVVDRCGVREGLVRSCITTKCADENKMYKMRLKKKANIEYFEENQQNIPPAY